MFSQIHHISLIFHISGIDCLNINKLPMTCLLSWFSSLRPSALVGLRFSHAQVNLYSPLLLPHICRMCHLCVFDCHRGGYIVCSYWIWYKLGDLFCSKGFDASACLISRVLQLLVSCRGCLLFVFVVFFITIAAYIASLLLIFFFLNPSQTHSSPNLRRFLSR